MARTALALVSILALAVITGCGGSATATKEATAAREPTVDEIKESAKFTAADVAAFEAAKGAGLAAYAAAVTKRGRGACDGVPDAYGLTQQTPLEIGLLAAGNALFAGLLVCPSGATPDVSRQGSFAAAADTKLVGEPIGTGKLAPKPLLDGWVVRCPGAPEVRLWSNLYTQGPFCAPKPFELIPSAAAAAYARAGKASEAGDTERALREVDEALRLGGAVEAYVRDRSLLLFLLDRFEESRAALRQAMTIRPGLLANEVALAVVEHKLGDFGASDAIAQRCLSTTTLDGETRAMLTCLRARNEHAQKHRKAAVTLAKEACTLGSKPCCSFPPKP